MRSFSGLQHRWAARRLGAAMAFAVLALLGGCGGGDGLSAVLQASWMAAPVNIYQPRPAAIPALPPSTLENQTVRHIVRASAGGDGLRVRISNRFGSVPLKLGPVHAARSVGRGRIDAATGVALQFSGSATVTLAPGQEVWSDVAPMSVPGNADIAISIYVPEKAEPSTMHPVSYRQSYGATGNLTTAAELAPASLVPPSSLPVSPVLWVSGMDVRTTTARGTIVAIGDSITDGTGATMDGVASYPSQLARRVEADGQLAGYSVVNAGIAGNRLLSDGYLAGYGDRLVDRFERDALQVTGATHVIALIGINDIGIGVLMPSDARTVDELQAGLQKLVDKAKAKNIKIYLGTLLPYEGALYFRPEGEAKRQALNTWIRANSAKATGVIDFDAAIRDPARPSRMLPAYDSGDKLHPGDKGYEAMARAVDLVLFR